MSTRENRQGLRFTKPKPQAADDRQEPEAQPNPVTTRQATPEELEAARVRGEATRAARRRSRGTARKHRMFGGDWD